VNELEINNSVFESIKHIDESGIEYWYARELQKVLTYKEWRKFNNVVLKAKSSCINSGASIYDHFVQSDKMIETAKRAKRKILDYKLSRYACYLIAQNGDSHMPVIALAQTYFAMQTRKQELLEKEYETLSEDEKNIRKFIVKQCGTIHGNFSTLIKSLKEIEKNKLTNKA